MLTQLKMIRITSKHIIIVLIILNLVLFFYLVSLDQEHNALMLRNAAAAKETLAAQEVCVALEQAQQSLQTKAQTLPVEQPLSPSVFDKPRIKKICGIIVFVISIFFG